MDASRRSRKVTQSLGQLFLFPAKLRLISQVLQGTATAQSVPCTGRNGPIWRIGEPSIDGPPGIDRVRAFVLYLNIRALSGKKSRHVNQAPGDPADPCPLAVQALGQKRNAPAQLAGLCRGSTDARRIPSRRSLALRIPLLRSRQMKRSLTIPHTLHRTPGGVRRPAVSIVPC